MIILTAYNTNRKLYIDEKDIEKVVDGHDLVGIRSFPWSDVTVTQEDGGSKVVRVVESARHIGKLMSEAMVKKSQDKKNTEEK